MARPWRTPNQRLRALLREAGWSGARLAREVNALAAEHRRSLHYDRSAVSHWLAGTQPRAPAPQFVAEALSRRLGRRIDVQDTGLTGRAHGGTAAPPRRTDPTAHLLLGLGTAPTDTGVYSPSASLVRDWGHWTPLQDRPPTAPQPAPGAPDLAAARAMLRLFSCHEAWFGGGSARHALRGYLATNITTWLGQDLRPAVRRELLTTAGHLAYLCAFTHIDSELQVPAQRYYFAAAELARAADDRVGYAMAVRGLSVQALVLGHAREADLLADRAVRVGLPQARTPGRRAFFLGQLALTRAATGELRQAEAHFAAAAAHLDDDNGPEPGRSPIGSFHLGSLAFQQAYAARMRDDRRREAAYLDASLRHRPQQEQRGRALGIAALAEAQLDTGHLDLACATWLSFLDLYPRIESARATGRLRTLLARLRPYTANRGAADVYDRARSARIRHRGRQETD